MGKAGTALRQVLDNHDISQNQLAKKLGVERTTVYRWANEVTDPSGETIVEIVEALRTLKTEAAREFVQLYLGETLESEEE